MRGSYPIPPQNVIEYEEEEDNDFADDDEEDEQNPDQNYSQNGGYYNHDDFKRHPKKRKLESFVSNNAYTSPVNHRMETWSEEDTFLLLEVWGERYMELGRRSLRGEDWADVTEKIIEMSGIERNEVECRNQLDVLKNKYKKERLKVETGQGSKWVFFKKMDGLLNVRMKGNSGLGCGVDSGEYVFMNPQVYLDRSNVLDEMRDSPVESDEENEDDGEDEEESGGQEGNSESAKMLAESIQRFGEVYEKIEESKRKQMMDLEKMRLDFQRELELQKKQIVERAQAEIAKIREMNEEDEDDNTDTSVDNLGE